MPTRDETTDEGLEAHKAASDNALQPDMAEGDLVAVAGDSVAYLEKAKTEMHKGQ